MGQKRKILIAVTGMSPQILTETVYALHMQQDWLPDEIFVLTTQTGSFTIYLVKTVILSAFAKTTYYRQSVSANRIYTLFAMRTAKGCTTSVRRKKTI